jgi:hypothetical protein
MQAKPPEFRGAAAATTACTGFLGMHELIIISYSFCSVHHGHGPEDSDQ